MSSLPEPVALWQLAWRVGIAPELTDAELSALARALKANAPYLLQGETLRPPSLMQNANLPPLAACPLGVALWKGRGLVTVLDVEEAFARLLHKADEALGWPTSSAVFLNHVDEVPRDQLIRELLAEVQAVLAEREECVAA